MLLLCGQMLNRSCVDDDTKGIGIKMDGTDKINEMVGNVEDDGSTVLLGDQPAAEVQEPAKAAEKAEPASQEADPLNLMQQEPAKAEEKAETAEKLDPNFLMPPKTAHISEVIKQRKRAQAAEAKVAELEAAQGQQTEDNPYADLSGVLENPDELVDGHTVAKLVQQGVQQGIKNYQDTVEASQTSQQATTAQKAKLDKSFEATRQQHEDFDQVTTTAAKQDLFTDSERAEILSSKNPYALLYAKSKERLGILGQKPASGTKQVENTNVNNDLLDPDQPANEQGNNNMGIYEVMQG